MVYKKLAACVLLCGVTHTCMSMEYLGSAVGAVKSGYNTASEKMYPTAIFKKIHAKWAQADDRKKVTLLHKLDRGFLDGHLKEQELTPLLDSIEDTVPKYPISQQTLVLIHEHLATKLPTLQARSNIMFRAIKAMYLLSPERLATDVANRKLLNIVTDQTERETIVSIIAQSIIKAGNAGQANQLIGSLEKQAKEVPFGTTAQVTLKEFLATTAAESYRSCEYVDSLGNSKEDTALKQQAVAAQVRIKQFADLLKAAQVAQAHEEQAIEIQIQEIEQRNAQIRANLAAQMTAVQQLQAQLVVYQEATQRLEVQYIEAQEAKEATGGLVAEQQPAKQPTGQNNNNVKK